MPDKLEDVLLSRATKVPAIDEAFERLYRQRPELANLAERLALTDLGQGVTAQVPMPLDGRTIELNTRMVPKMSSNDWEATLVHELTHLSDMRDPYDRKVANTSVSKFTYGKNPFELRAVDAAKEYKRRKALGQEW